MSDFGPETDEYMSSRGVGDTSTLKPGYGGGEALGLKDIRSRLGNRTGWMILVAAIFLLVILACIGVLFSYIRSEDDAKTFYDKHTHMINSTSSIIIAVSGIFFITFGIYLGYQWKNLDKEDSVLTDMARLGLEPLERKEIHNGLTDLIANRAGLSDFQRAQLRENIGNTVSVDNSNLYQNYLAAPENTQRIREQFAKQATEQGNSYKASQNIADEKINNLREQLFSTQQQNDRTRELNDLTNQSFREARAGTMTQLGGGALPVKGFKLQR